ncbi:MAG: hypothetical protein AAGA96_03125 [Verrucomicrobiota bacterium]
MKVRVVSFPKSLETEEVELLIDKDKTIKVETPSNELSKTYTVPVQKVWRLGYTITGDDGKPTFKILGEAPSPASSSQLLLLVRKGSKMADGFKVIPIDYRPSEFDKGEMLFVNATRVSVAGDVGTQKFGLKPGELKIIEPKADETGRLCQAVLYYAKNGRVEPFFSSKWPVNNNSKSLIFVYQGDKDRKLRLHAVRDFSP